MKQPNSAHCFACGMENEYGLKLPFYGDGELRVVCEYIISDQYQGFPGIAHGGIVTTLLDEALVRAFMTKDPNRFMYTAKLTVRFRKQVPTEQLLKIEGEVVKDRGRMGESKAKILGPDGDILAEAEALVVALEEEMQPERREELGWKVYED